MGVYVKTDEGLAPIATVPAPGTTNADVAGYLQEEGPTKNTFLASVDAKVDPVQTQVDALAVSGTLAPQGTFDAGVAYATRDLVDYAGDVWVAKEPTLAGDTPGVSAKWSKMISGLPSTSYITNIATNPKPTTTTGWKRQLNGGAAPASTIETTGYRISWTGDSIPVNAGVYYETAAATVTKGQVYSAAYSVIPSVDKWMRVSFYWRNAANDTTIGTTHGAYVLCLAGKETRLSASASAPKGADRVWVSCYSQDGWQAGQVVDYSKLLIVNGRTLPDYFDGTTAQARWDGTANASTSTLIAQRLSDTAVFARSAMRYTLGTMNVRPWQNGSNREPGGTTSYKMVGKDGTSDFFVDTGNTNLYESRNGEVNWYPKGLPANTSTGNIHSVGKLQVLRHGGFYYAIVRDTVTMNYSVYRAAPTTNANDPFVWSGALHTLQAGSTGYPTCMTSDGTTLLVAEYNDPVNGSGVPAAKVYRTTNGTTWSTVYTAPATTRHFHAIEFDPFNTGHVWATLGDAGGTITIRSKDSGTTWSAVHSATGWQSVQISFDRDWVWLASDQDGTNGAIVNRDTHATYSIGVGWYGNIAVPGGAAGDLFYSKAWFGAVDPDTGVFYFWANNSSTGGNKRGIFALRSPNSTPILLDTETMEVSDNVARLYITEDSVGNKMIRVGSRRIPAPVFA